MMVEPHEDTHLMEAKAETQENVPNDVNIKSSSLFNRSTQSCRCAILVSILLSFVLLLFATYPFNFAVGIQIDDGVADIEQPKQPKSILDGFDKNEYIGDNKIEDHTDNRFIIDSSNKDIMALDWFNSLEGIKRRVKDCDDALAKLSPNTLAWKLKRADCGSGYKFPDPKNPNQHPWKVGLFPKWKDHYLQFSGCSLGKNCPLSPHCEFVYLQNVTNINNVNVTLSLANGNYWRSLLDVPKHPGTYRVLYWREALWEATPSRSIQRTEFDFEMGVHTYAAIPNPSFLLRPTELLSGMYESIPHTEFAASAISDCNAPSQRELYIDQLTKYLGPSRIHRYGACGNRSLPPKPIRRAMKILAKYKFYLAFENEIQVGYMTDPKELADYLLHLDANPDKYAEYHEWRTNPQVFTDYYLKSLQDKVPGPAEILAHYITDPKKSWLSPRRAACCRLCDSDYVEYSKQSRGPYDFAMRFSESAIAKRFFRKTVNNPGK